MNNKENYKKAIDQIQASEELKQRTIENIKKTKRTKKYEYMKLLSACAIFAIVFLSGAFYFNQNNEIIDIENKNVVVQTQISKVNSDLPRFKNMEELKAVLKEQYRNTTDGIMKGELSTDLAITESVMDVATATGTQNKLNDLREESTNKEYSTTNVQVENVDEADIVKTDGKYIYYVTNRIVYIIEANNLIEIAKINFNTEKENFTPNEIYIKDNKLVVLGNSYTYFENRIAEEDMYIERINGNNMAKAIVFDISDKANPIEVRSVALDGYTVNSRMIGDNLYFISNKTPNYYKGILDDEILPIVRDSVREDKIIACTDIAYFENTNSHSFMTVAGFNINDNSEVYTETFFGASSNIYCSEDNLYITQIIYNNGYYWGDNSNIIYKFNLNDSQIVLQAKGEVKGYLNDQFSMDEYNGNLRIATTAGGGDDSTNQLYILDENLKEISRIENLARGEKIYAVRFIGKIGYIVTFKEIDPLFVIDLSDPKNPVVKGELKIPGYSSYLHPYDETHIIGIGYNTKSNGYGGVTNANMKMSMFDVSDLENPKEMFSVDIGERYASSPITYNHKALFYNKSRDLIGFPITLREYNSNKDRNGFMMFKIDLNEGFIKYGEILEKINYRTNIDRGIYIGDKLYTLAEMKIVKYDLNTLEKLAEIDLTEKEIYVQDDKITTHFFN